jgi:hypothetical protein
MLRKLLANSTGFIVRRNAQSFDIFAEIRNPIGKSMQLFAKFRRWSVAERLWISHRLCSRRSVGGADRNMINISTSRFPQGSGYS